MCACYFRAQGKDFDVDSYLSESPLRSSASIGRKGESKSIGTGLRDFSSFSISVIDDDNSTVAQQMTACRSFISDNLQELERLRKYPGRKIRLAYLIGYVLSSRGFSAPKKLKIEHQGNHSMRP